MPHAIEPDRPVPEEWLKGASPHRQRWVRALSPRSRQAARRGERPRRLGLDSSVPMDSRGRRPPPMSWCPGTGGCKEMVPLLGVPTRLPHGRQDSGQAICVYTTTYWAW